MQEFLPMRRAPNFQKSCSFSRKEKCKELDYQAAVCIYATWALEKILRFSQNVVWF